MAGLGLLAPASSLAANLIANPGFETAGSSGTVFSDTLPDLNAWQITSGNYTLSGGVITSQGFGPSTDLAIVKNSQDYQNGVFTVVATPLTVAPQETGGVVIRYRDTSNFYLCGITKGSVVVQRRLGGTDSVLASAAYTSAVNSSYTLTATATGTQISCKVSGPGGTATATVTEANFASGNIGVAAINSNPSQLRQMKFSQPAMSATVPQSWSALGAFAGRPGLVPDLISPNSGTSFLQLFGGASAFSGSSQQTSIAVSGGSTYTLTAAIRTDSVTGSAKVVAVEPDGTTTTLGSVSGTTAWTVYSTSFTTKPATTSLTIRVQLDGSGRAGFDDLSLSVTPSVTLRLSASSVDFGGVDPISSPFVLSPALTATVTSNTTWSLAFAGSGDFADGTGKTFPLAQLGWRLTGSGAGYTAASTASQTLTTGVANTPSGTATPIDLRLQVTYADPVSSQPFQTTLTYIATTP